MFALSEITLAADRSSIFFFIMDIALFSVLSRHDIFLFRKLTELSLVTKIKKTVPWIIFGDKFSDNLCRLYSILTFTLSLCQRNDMTSFAEGTACRKLRFVLIYFLKCYILCTGLIYAGFVFCPELIVCTFLCALTECRKFD